MHPVMYFFVFRIIFYFSSNWFKNKAVGNSAHARCQKGGVPEEAEIRQGLQASGRVDAESSSKTQSSQFLERGLSPSLPFPMALAHWTFPGPIGVFPFWGDFLAIQKTTKKQPVKKLSLFGNFDDFQNFLTHVLSILEPFWLPVGQFYG